MSQQQVAAQVANLLGKVGKWSVFLGIGGSVLQSALYTGIYVQLAQAPQVEHISPFADSYYWVICS